MASQVSQDATGRAGRLAWLFRQVLKGDRKIRSANEAKLFFEAARAQSAPSTCMEEIVASKYGLEALRLSVRMDLGPAFINSQTLPFIGYLSDAQLKLLADGNILQQALVAITKPPTLWNVLVGLAKIGGLEGEDLRIFTWLCLELLALPTNADLDVTGDVESILQNGRILDATCPATRQLGYKIQHLLQLRKSPTSRPGDSYVPGGRHDNDFEDFRKISVYPTTDEFLCTERPFYRRAKEVFETEMSERAAAHLDNIYRLTREDLLGELRSDWQNAQVRNRGKRSAVTLQKLWPVGVELGDEKHQKKCALAISCGAGLERLTKVHPSSRKKWLNDNKNFLRHQAFGALYQGQEIFGFGFVDRNLDALLLSPPVVILQFTDDKAFKKALLAFKMANDVMFTLVDTPVFAYEPVLERLKDMTELPLQDKLLNPSEALDDFVPVNPVRQITTQFTERSEDVEIKIKNGSTSKTFQLDPSQQQSLVNALESKISVIQGPPGTGKSFIGALAAHYILKFTQLKILVITYTNHALDQFLEDLLRFGIDEDLMVRLGSKSTSCTSPLLLSAQRYEYRRTKESWTVIDKLKAEGNEYGEMLKEALVDCLRARPTFETIQAYLEFSEDEGKFFEAFSVPSENSGFKMVGRKGKEVRSDYLYDRWRAGSGPGMFKKQAFSGHSDVWHMEVPQRKKLIEKWCMAILQEKAESVRQLAKQYDLVQDQLKFHFSESKVQVVREKRIIGCTTTAAAMYPQLITAAQPDIVLVEEAGEIQESHILTALTPTVQQILLIGDHKQLRPKVNNYNLTVEKGEGYDLNRSLFERLVLQGHPYTTLHKQHRMHPDISVLVRELTYPDLEDGPNTSSRPPLHGLEDRVIFVNHDHPEEQTDRISDKRDQGTKSSKENIFEAEMVLKTVRYLAQQGYKTKDMVVLTPYLGQLRLVRDMLIDEVDPWLSDPDSYELIQAGLLTNAAAKVQKEPLRMSTIDNYQGEEARIVIVSLTRSNSNGDIGFLAARERLNVLLSRARDGLIMIGNIDTYVNSKRGKETWAPFFDLMKAKRHLYDGVPVHCEKHPERQFLLKKPEDFDKCCPDGGCAESCGVMLNCGQHKCEMRCHRVTDHSQMSCPYKLEVTCDRGHKLKVACCERNDKCFKCVKEDKEIERRIKRDLKLEAERVSRQEAYRRDLEKVQDEIDHQRRIIRYRQDDEDQRKILAQQRADLASLKDTVSRVLTVPKPPPVVLGSSPSADPPTPPGSSEILDILEGAQQEWEDLKQFEGAKSEPLDELMGMIGLEDVKSSFLAIKKRVDTALRQNISLQKERFSCSMLGNPGTGKTTVARLYAKFLSSIGAIPGCCFREETGAGLANNGVNGCKKIIDDMLNDGGGILFIDEAYQLTSGNSFGGGAVLDYLLPEVENLSGKVVFVLAGYNKQMESFFAHNLGLPSRFPVDMKFEDYTDDELLRILELKIHNKYNGRMACEDGLRGLYCRIATRRVGRCRGRDGFGNARAIENTLANVAQRQAVRLTRERRAGTKPDDLLFTKEDLIGPEPTGALGKSKAWQELQKLIGLKSVKEAVKALVDSVVQNYQRELDEQPPIEFSLNKVFTGNPGTGKTTVAKMYGRILVDLGMLSKGEVVVKNPSDFVGSVMGESEKLTKGILAATLGKVLVIDEAYGLCGNAGSNSDPYKTAVIDTIVAEVQSVPGDDRCVLLLGYKDQMEAMFQKVNPGLSRRFPISSAFEFDDFDNEELRMILNMKLQQQGFDATDQAKHVAAELLERAKNRPNFGNAGEIDIILNDAKARHQRRLSRRETTLVSTFDARDFDEDFDRAERADTNVAKLFEGTVGNEQVVVMLQEYQENVKAMKQLGIDPKENIPFNFLFKGPPGTGKTTTAKKMGKVFYDMGFLATAEVIECSATDLVGQYVGQTGPKVQQMLDKALGKVLFIDEAYRLGEGHFSKEAMDEIVDAVTKDKYAKKMIIILAGYEHDINRLLQTNQGLTSRFPEAISFRSLSPDECIKLLVHDFKTRQTDLKAKQKNLDIAALGALTDSSRKVLAGLFSELSQHDSWASARDVKEAAKAIFRKVLKDKEGLSTGCLTVKMEVVEGELRRMLQERENRSHNISTPLRTLSGPVQQMVPQLPPSIKVRTSTTTSQATVQKPPTPEPGDQEPLSRPAQEIVEADSNKKEGTRDIGVSDKVWEQLQKDREVEEQQEQEYQDLLKAQRMAREEDRQRITKKLLEEEERRKKEKDAQKKLEASGMCPVGYQWIKQAGGYRCAGGSHFMSDTAVEQF